jgi:putative transposase
MEYGRVGVQLLRSFTTNLQGGFMDYRRTYVDGGCYFFTVALANREGDLLVQHIETLRAAFRYVKERHPFKIDAMVVLPDHLHCIWTLPEGDCDYAKRWALIKIYFSKKIPKTELVNTSRIKKGERGVWQRRFWEHVIRDERDFLNHMEYIHINPIKHGYVLNAIDWPYSSIHKIQRRLG